ncbi:MAG: helix-turn-helix domain-containing protein [Butyrivibrio sp.]|nr:helix-turn-helix domain-containing protein [Butyrivibrio sp.]
MKNNIKDVINTLQIIYNSTFMPIHLFENGKCISSMPVSELPEDFIITYRNSLVLGKKSLHYFSTKEFLLVGIIKSDTNDLDIVMGPVSTTALSEADIDSLIASYSLPVDYKEQIWDFYDRTPRFTMSQFLNIMTLINKELNGNIIDVFEYFGFTDKAKKQSVGKHHSHALIENKEQSQFHDTYFFEQQYYGYIERGDLEGLQHFIQQVPSFTEGRTSNDSLRQAKNIFISTTAIITRRAIAGGLDIETAYQLSDSYIQEAEKMSDQASILALNATSAIDFTSRVAEAKIPKGMPEDIYLAIQFIANHVNQNISVEEIAKHLNMDRSTLSKKFKRELGFNISSYIMRRKLEEAKSLLTYTDKTISEISEYLCFSTQSYFQNVFKAKYGMTPKEYRKNQKK